jgi:transcription-repair coupling factor (superfamily II helicase)
MLEQAVGEMRGEAPKVRRETHVELGVEALIPLTYVPADRQRMEIYRRLAGCGEPEELRQLQADLADAYGPPPLEVETLVGLAEVRVLAGRLGIGSIIRQGPDLVFTIADHEASESVFKRAAGTVRMPDARTAHWRPPTAYMVMPTMVNVLLKRLRDASGAKAHASDG